MGWPNRLRLVVLCHVLVALTLFGQSNYDEPWRPQFHFTPDHNFMNDPNGLVFYKGEYHLFYQYNPESRVWGHMSWGHAVSSDMLHWKHLPVAIPEAKGKYMIYSGSVVVDMANSSGFCKKVGSDHSCLVAMYTAAAKDADGTEHQSQNIAYSNDRGRTWTGFAGNPVVDLKKPDFRDPKVFWYEPQKKWLMVAVLADQRKLLIFDSPDLKKWRQRSEFGPTNDASGQWECPDLFELPVDGTSERRWVLAINRNPGAPAGGTGTRYLVGSFDGEKFSPDSLDEVWADYGKDFYATHRFSAMGPGDNRSVWIGWIGNWQYANKEPTEIWRGAQSLPRELKLRMVGGQMRLVQSPIAEAKKLRQQRLFANSCTCSTVGEITERLKKEHVEGDTLEIVLQLESEDWNEIGLRLRVGPQQETVVGISRASKSVFINRTRSGEVDFAPEFPGRHSATLSDVSKVSLRIFLDRSSVEVFVNDGEVVMTDRIYPARTSRGLEIFADSPRVKVKGLEIWKLSSVWHSEADE